MAGGSARRETLFFNGKYLRLTAEEGRQLADEFPVKYLQAYLSMADYAFGRLAAGTRSSGLEFARSFLREVARHNEAVSPKDKAKIAT